MDRSIEIETRLAAPIAHVWSAWTDPARLVDWYPDRASGRAAAGGTLRFGWHALEQELELEVVEAIPQARLVLRADPTGLGAQTQTLELARDGDGTALWLRHEGFGPGDDDLREGTESGWHVALAFLRRYVESYYGASRTSAWILGLAPAGFERLFERYTRPDWLGAGGPIGEVGDRYRLALAEGGAMTGQVLARRAPRELALSWDELDGVIALRAFSVAPGAKLAGIQLATWALSEQELQPIGEALARAVDRLVSGLGGASALA